jgi:hypothetical protein
MTHPDDQSWRAAVNEELRRITTLDDTIAGTLNNIRSLFRRGTDPTAPEWVVPAIPAGE